MHQRLLMKQVAKAPLQWLDEICPHKMFIIKFSLLWRSYVDKEEDPEFLEKLWILHWEQDREEGTLHINPPRVTTTSHAVVSCQNQSTTAHLVQQSEA